MKLTWQSHRENALDFIALSGPKPEPGERIDRQQLAEQMQYTIADAEDVEAIAKMIEQLAGEGQGNMKQEDIREWAQNLRTSDMRVAWQKLVPVTGQDIARIVRTEDPDATDNDLEQIAAIINGKITEG